MSLGPPPGTHLQQDAISVPLNLGGRIRLHRALQNQLPRGQAHHRAGASGPNNIWRGWGQRENMRHGPAPAGPSRLPLLPAPDTPTLNPDPEALLHFTSRVVGQASVQPIIAHLGMEQGKQPPLAPGCLPPGLLSYN